MHEEAHRNKDWIEDSLKPEIQSFKDWCADHAIDIDCGVLASTVCTDALTPAVMAAYEAKWGEYIDAAIVTFNSQIDEDGCTADAKAATVACYQSILDALKTKCP